MFDVTTVAEWNVDNELDNLVEKALAGQRDHNYEQAWADAIAQASSNFADVCDPNVLDQLILWKLASRSKDVQRKWHIEITADFADEGRYAAVTRAVQMASAVLSSKLGFGADQGVKPQIAAWSDDWFGNNEQINIWAAELEGTTGAFDNPDKVSDELLEAMQEMKAKQDGAA